MRRLLFALALVASLAAAAAARAGGGQNYSGGSHSSYSSSSYSSSSSGGYSSSGGPDVFDFFIVMYVDFCSRHPLLGLLMTLFVVWVVWTIHREINASPLSRPLSGGSVEGGAQLSSVMAEELARLTARDPGFDPNAFLRRSSDAFLKIQEAWSAGDMSGAGAFISDGVRERFARQLADMKSRGVRNLMENVEISECEILACRSDAHFDSIWVRIAASAEDRMVDAKGSTLEGSSGPTEFEEVWAFLRRPGAKTLKGRSLVEGSCPSCGAPLSITDAAQCAACKSFVNSGDYDWVLAEITQACEWALRDPARDVDGWAAAAEGDPALNLASLEDRVSVLFWRWLDPKEWLDAAVGGVEVVAFESGGPETRAHVMVKWSARRANGSPEMRRLFFILARAAGVKTDARQGLRTARCAACGAPTSNSQESACAYCGAGLNDPKKDWVLKLVQPFGEWRRPAGAAASGSRMQPSGAGVDWGAGLSPAEALAVLAKAMMADGEVSIAERAYLDAYAKTRGLPAVKANDIVAAARAGLLDVPAPSDPEKARTMLRGMVRMSLADGVVSEQERSLLLSFGAPYGIGADDVAAMIVAEREAMGRAVRGVE